MNSFKSIHDRGRGDGVVIRPFEGGDWGGVWAILEPVFRAGETYAVAVDISEAEARRLWTGPPKSAFVAEDRGSGQLLGTYYLKPNHEGPGSHVCNCGYVVAQSARGRGLASMMCVDSQREAVERGFRAMQFNLVAASNEGAARLWRELGFDIVGTLPGAFRHPRLGFVDAHVMFKALIEAAREPIAPVTFRPLTPDDMKLLHDWLGRPHVSRWWGRPASLSEVRASYLPMTDPAASTRGYVALQEGRAIGFVQTYTALGSGDGWWEDETDPGVRGVDVLLAGGDRLNRGLGSAMLRAFCDLLFLDPAVTRVQADPSPENLRAIGCYQSAGFEPQGEIVTPDGAALLLVRPRPAG